MPISSLTSPKEAPEQGAVQLNTLLPLLQPLLLGSGPGEQKDKGCGKSVDSLQYAESWETSVAYATGAIKMSILVSFSPIISSHLIIKEFQSLRHLNLF